MPSGTVVSSIYALDAVVALTAAVVIGRRRDAPGAASLSAMLFAASFWAVCDAIELQVPTVRLKQLVSQIQYIGVIAAAPFYFEAAIALSGEHVRLTRTLRFWVWSIPLASLGFAWTNDLHHWLWTRIAAPSGDSPFATYHYGWWFWVLTAQNYLLMVGASAALLRGLHAVSHGFRTAMAVVLVATILPWIGNAAYNLKLGPWPGLNWLTLSLGISGWLLVWVVVRGGLLDLLPQARGALIEMMTDAVFVLDRSGRVIDTNRTARETLGGEELPGLLGTLTLRHAAVEWQRQIEVNLPQGRRWLDVRVGPVLDRWGVPAGRIAVVRDITRQKRLEHEREDLIDELQEALRRVTQLEGLLPVCAACHSVRDDSGSWTSIEAYLALHTPVEFTHGICPDCLPRLYPEIVEVPLPAARTA